jgi:hypothetical protein
MMRQTQKNPDAPFYRQMAACERVIVEVALANARWNRKQAARTLGISYRNLLYKIEKLEIEVSTFQGCNARTRFSVASSHSAACEDRGPITENCEGGSP